ncbi:MBL fold metallo-hydrolase [Magnetospira sp. QH-2]|uniref:MBL fold metallo-hydrolase n=1 Tax=Magnetospira sp. (strain QH-2) TaxID=1288970 RepID=UPI0003E81BE7|nr:MBL fold metallo-hydrolase [Magnetospira sp. QH-2]CCQ74670.1 putative metallo-beta-lactamase superfamily protein [Magnetospira sp. QH-2]
MTRFILAFAALLIASATQAAGLSVERVADNVYAIVGPHQQRSADNLGNNCTFGFVVTDQGVLLVDPGGSAKGAAAIEAAIRTVTDQPVKIVINSGGQDHRWLGNGYFKQRGARIIASAAAVADQKDRTEGQFFMLTQLMGAETLEGTEPTHADQTFEERLDLSFGGESFELYHVGAAHTPGDAFIWMPEKKIVFTGDIVFTERALGTGPARDTDAWIAAFKAVEALNPAHVVPGHGHPTTIEKARADTHDYLAYLRKEIGAILERGGAIEEGIAIDQSAFSYLQVFEQIAKRNAQNVYMEMEFE